MIRVCRYFAMALATMFVGCEALHARVGLYRLSLADKQGSARVALTQRALDRRTRQGIDLDDADFGVSPIYLSALTQQGYKVVAQSRWLNTVVVAPPSGSDECVEAMQTLPFVTACEKVADDAALFYPELSEYYEDEPVQTSLKAPGRMNRKGIVDLTEAVNYEQAENFTSPIYEVNGQSLYNQGFRGAGMHIAIIDGGYYHLNQFDWLRSKVSEVHNLYCPGDTVELYRADVHGAMVMSIMASDTTHGIWGTACEAQYSLFLTEFASSESPFEEDQWVAAAEMADSMGVDAINSSLGYGYFDNEDFNHPKELLGTNGAFITQGANVAASKGMLVCCSAGNEGRSSWKRLMFPSDAENILTVGATDNMLLPANFTSVGFTQPFVKPDVAARGSSCYVLNCETGGVMRGSGTSFSTPFVCGLATSLWAATPQLTAAQIRQVIRESASQFATPDSIIGYGLPDFDVALQKAQALQRQLSGIESIGCDARDDANAPCYDMMGRRINGIPRRGLYIQNGKVRYCRNL